MNARLDQCRFPSLAPEHDAALRAATAYVLSAFDPVGIVATGTIVRGNPDPASDLDIWVIHLAPVRQRVQKRFNGVPAELFVNPPWTVEAYFRTEAANGNATTAHMLATGFVVLDRAPVVGDLRRKAAAALEMPPKLTDEALLRERYIAATHYEDVCDLYGRDPRAADLLLGHTLFEIARYAFLKQRRYVPRNKDLAGALERLDPQAGVLMSGCLAATEAGEKRKLAEQLADHVLGTRGFFEWETAAEAQPAPAEPVAGDANHPP